MAALYRQKTKVRVSAPPPCKACGSHETIRAQRTFLEKFLSFLSSGKYAYQKYYCKACDTFTYRSVEERVEGKQLITK